MDSRELLDLIGALANERRLKMDVVYEIVEAAIEAATRRQLGRKDILIEVEIDKVNGTYRTFILKPQDESLIEEYGLLKRIPHELMDREEIENLEFDRIATQSAKQMVFQKIKEAEREQRTERALQNIGKLYRGQLRRSSAESLIIESSEGNFVLPKTDLLPGDFFRVGDTVSAVLMNIESTGRGLRFILSRTTPDMTRQLLSQEVPEIGEELIEIKAVGRVPGVRSKVAVKTNDRRLDPIGACIGMSGSRIQSVMRGLGGEKVDIVLWDDRPSQLITNLLAPAVIKSIFVDEASKSVDVEVTEENLPIAVGRNGINVQLAKRISGFDIHILSESEMRDKRHEKRLQSAQSLSEQLGLTAEQAEGLVDSGFQTISHVAFSDRPDLVKALGGEEALASALQEKASQLLLDEELSSLLQVDHREEELAQLAGMTPEVLEKLKAIHVESAESLAELSTDELLEAGIPKSLAEKLIMEARRPWFEN